MSGFIKKTSQGFGRADLSIHDGALESISFKNISLHPMMGYLFKKIGLATELKTTTGKIYVNTKSLIGRLHTPQGLNGKNKKRIVSDLIKSLKKEPKSSFKSLNAGQIHDLYAKVQALKNKTQVVQTNLNPPLKSSGLSIGPSEDLVSETSKSAEIEAISTLQADIPNPPVIVDTKDTMENMKVLSKEHLDTIGQQALLKSLQILSGEICHQEAAIAELLKAIKLVKYERNKSSKFLNFGILLGMFCPNERFPILFTALDRHEAVKRRLLIRKLLIGALHAGDRQRIYAAFNEFWKLDPSSICYDVGYGGILPTILVKIDTKLKFEEILRAIPDNFKDEDRKFYLKIFTEGHTVNAFGKTKTYDKIPLGEHAIQEVLQPR